MNNLSWILLISALVYIWADTDAFIEWAALFKIKATKYEEYEASKTSLIRHHNYSEFLGTKYRQNFFCKLVSCPVCLSVWLNILSIPFISLSLIGLNIYLTWVFYFLLKNLINKSQ